MQWRLSEKVEILNMTRSFQFTFESVTVGALYLVPPMRSGKTGGGSLATLRLLYLRFENFLEV
jgi:hypothetical protein